MPAHAFSEPAEGVLRLGTSLINWYVVADDEGVTLVDAGAPAHHAQLERGLHQLGRTSEDVRAVILTHGDPDHKGFAEKLREERGLSVYVHSADAELTRTGHGNPREASFLPYLRYPATWRLIAELVRGGMPLNVGEVQTFEDGDVLDVPGHPRVIHAPGHKAGCVAFHFERQDVLFVGDILYTLNVLTGRRGPQIGPAAFNESSDQALASLDRLEDVQAGVVLCGHGEPWTDGPAAAVAAARRAGKS
jgi:glyoxylase-like metal-dependent hydrolase (beta-lactamase superfamily II)